MRREAAVVASFFLWLVGCTRNEPFRTNFDPPSPNCPQAVIESRADYKLGFVEFDDQGWFWDARQLVAVEQMIRTQAGMDKAPATKSQGIILLAFVHGWKENAAYDGDGVRACRDILQQLSNAENAQTDHPPRKVVGVYAGWRGLSATWEPFKELSFWERKDTAHKVGGYGAMTKLLVELESLQKRSLDSLPANAPRTELIIIGHSFGGAAVYSALSQIIIERFVESVEKHKRLKPLGDQVILLNPAFEALRHYDLNQMALGIEAYPHDQRPVLSIFTSRGDGATHYAFPVGRFFATLFDTSRSGEQKAASLESVGWFKPFVTHELTYSAKALFATTQATTLNPATRKPEYHSRSQLKQSVDNLKAERGKWHPNAATPQTYYFDDSILKPMKGFRPGDPFLIVSVDPQIMHDHNDITNPVLINFLREYIQFSQVDPTDHSK